MKNARNQFNNCQEIELFEKSCRIRWSMMRFDGYRSILGTIGLGSRSIGEIIGILFFKTPLVEYLYSFRIFCSSFILFAHRSYFVYNTLVLV